jgi:purine-binding chemotaxis protein CheW
VGIVFDAVSEVLQANKEDIDAKPELGADMDINFILGMARIGNSVKMLLDIARVLSVDDVVVLSKKA